MKVSKKNNNDKSWHWLLSQTGLQCIIDLSLHKNY